ncbi:hypothetical protein KBC70_01095 [Candidatus Woesebacteria bacterium]|nr:hypothetical protein [Candidatus Woesebacteria bacterium]
MKTSPYHTVEGLISQELLIVGKNSILHPTTVYILEDYQGVARPITIGNNVRIDPFSILFGGVTIGDNTIIEPYVTIGKPELGYAVQKEYSGEGKNTKIGDRVIIRAHATLYDGIVIGNKTSIGHYTLIRNDVVIGNHTQLGHYVCVERGVHIGNYVRCSPHGHITSETVLEDRVFIGAHVATINDKKMVWKDKKETPTLNPPYFEHGVKVGTGSVIGSGVRIGRETLIGSHSLVISDIASNSIAYGSPAKIVQPAKKPISKK